MVGLDACTLEEIYVKYGSEGVISREDIFRFYFAAKNCPKHNSAVFSSQSNVGAQCSDAQFWASVKKVREYFGQVMDEIRWDRTLAPFNHCPHFPYFVTHFTDAMPISCMGGALSDCLWNPKKARCIWKVTVAIYFLGNILWISALQPGNSSDVLIWDQFGPQRTRGDFLEFETGCHDGAYQGRMHCVPPFIGRLHLTERQQNYNDVHGWYRARVEHVFGHLWHWGIVRHVWVGKPDVLHQTVRVLLHTVQFCKNRKVQYQPYGPWEHIPEGIWSDRPIVIPSEEQDGPDAPKNCALCYKRGSTECDSCKLMYCEGCSAVHSC